MWISFFRLPEMKTFETPSIVSISSFTSSAVSLKSRIEASDISE